MQVKKKILNAERCKIEDKHWSKSLTAAGRPSTGTDTSTSTGTGTDTRAQGGGKVLSVPLSVTPFFPSVCQIFWLPFSNLPFLLYFVSSFQTLLLHGPFRSHVSSIMIDTGPSAFSWPAQLTRGLHQRPVARKAALVPRSANRSKFVGGSGLDSILRFVIRAIDISSSLPSIISRRGACNSLHLPLFELPVLFLIIPRVRHQDPTKFNSIYPG